MLSKTLVPYLQLPVTSPHIRLLTCSTCSTDLPIVSICTDFLIEINKKIPPGAWMSVRCECCVLSGRGLGDEPITRPEESYRLWCVVMWSRNLKNEAMARVGPQRHREYCVLPGRGLGDEPITRPEESYRLRCVVMCDLETSRMRRPWPALGRSATRSVVCYQVEVSATSRSFVQRSSIDCDASLCVI